MKKARAWRGWLTLALWAGLAVPTLGGEAPTFEPAYGRADANCSLQLSAADVVAQVLGLGDASVCGNDDCDRDGGVTGADVDCVAGCLFGLCPVPEHAPVVEVVAAESASAIVPVSTVRVSGLDLARGAAPDRVTIRDEEAEVVEVHDTRIVALVPIMEPGPADLVVLTDGLAGRRFPTAIVAATAIGLPDTFLGMLELTTDAITLFTALDLTGLYPEEDLPIVLEVLTRLREQLTAVDLSGDAQLTAEAIARLDEMAEGSGVPERLRDLIADLRDGPSRPAPTAGLAARVARLVGSVVAIANAWRQIPTAGGSADLAALDDSTIAGSIAASAIAELAFDEGGGAGLFPGLRPQFLGVVFRDRHGNRQRRPTAGGSVELETARFSATLGTFFVINQEGFEWSPPRIPGDRLRYRLPDVSGFCGPIGFTLRQLGYESPRLSFEVKPELLGLAPTRARTGDELRLDVSGVKPCEGKIEYEGPLEFDIHRTASGATVALTQERLRANAGQVDGGTLRPGSYDVRVRVGGQRSDEKFPLDLKTAITGIEITCDERTLYTEGGSPDRTVCHARALPAGLQFPKGAYFRWTASQPALGFGEQGGTDVGIFTNETPGLVDVTVQAFVDEFAREPFAASVLPVTITVIDKTPPSIEFLCAEDGDDSVTLPVPGSFVFGVEDAGTLDRVEVSTTEDVFENQKFEIDCGAIDPTNPFGNCTDPIRVPVAAVGCDHFSTVVMKAWDLAGNLTEKECDVFVGDRPTLFYERTDKIVETVAEPPGGFEGYRGGLEFRHGGNSATYRVPDFFAAGPAQVVWSWGEPPARLRIVDVNAPPDSEFAGEPYTLAATGTEDLPEGVRTLGVTLTLDADPCCATGGVSVGEDNPTYSFSRFFLRDEWKLYVRIGDGSGFARRLVTYVYEKVEDCDSR